MKYGPVGKVAVGVGYDGLRGGKGRKGRSSRCCHQIKITGLPLVLFSHPFKYSIRNREWISHLVSLELPNLV